MSVTATLVEHCRDLAVELDARLGLMSPEDLVWQPHPDSNSAAITVWHVTRWFDVLATRAFTSCSAAADLWHTAGWCEQTGYEPDGIGYRGLGTLTGYTPDEMRAVPILGAGELRRYLTAATDALIARIERLGASLTSGEPASGTPYAAIATTLQGSFGHVGEIDTLVALRERWTTP